jgi:hypothetical protein
MLAYCTFTTVASTILSVTPSFERGIIHFEVWREISVTHSFDVKYNVRAGKLENELVLSD